MGLWEDLWEAELRETAANSVHVTAQLLHVYG